MLSLSGKSVSAEALNELDFKVAQSILKALKLHLKALIWPLDDTSYLQVDCTPWLSAFFLALVPPDSSSALAGTPDL